MKKIATAAVLAALLAAGSYVYAQTDNMAGMDHSGMNMGTDGMTMMSHAAIVCREYGLPAVTGTAFGTKNITTGQLIRVDGNTGTVTILEG